jgi:hypothetical protein
MGELIAKAVDEGVTEAIYRQNELTSKRSVFQRLGERKINVSGLILADECECENGKQDLIRAFDEIILDPKYAGFIEMSFSISDDYERGLVDNLASFERLCNGIAEEIAGKKIKETKNFISDNKEVPCALRMALNGLFNGLYYKTR